MHEDAEDERVTTAADGEDAGDEWAAEVGGGSAEDKHEAREGEVISAQLSKARRERRRNAAIGRAAECGKPCARTRLPKADSPAAKHVGGASRRRLRRRDSAARVGPRRRSAPVISRSRAYSPLLPARSHAGFLAHSLDHPSALSLLFLSAGSPAHALSRPPALSPPFCPACSALGSLSRAPARPLPS